jgi:ATP-dependent protease ClpP protease subunit
LDILSCTEGDIHVIMGTVGGEWNYGMGIYDAIKACRHKVIITAYAWARSMSSIILQAATERVLMPHCDFMIHYGTTSAEGHYLTVKSGMQYEERSEKIMLGIYAERCQHGNHFKMNHMSVVDIIKFLDRKMRDKGDWWLSAHEAVQYGFADRVA